jgi:hypothetical protein
MDLELKMGGRSDLLCATLDEEFDSRDVPCFVRREKCDSLGDFVRISEPA